MTSIEELLRRVQQAETETDRQWILLEMQMRQIPDALGSMLWASAIPHFFDADVLAALRPKLKESAAELSADLQALTFVEVFPGRGYNVHELTRELLLSRLWKQDNAEFLALSQRAADYFFEQATSLGEEVEFCYHEILNEKDAQTGRLLDKAVSWWTYDQPDYMQSALQKFVEHENADRLDTFGRGFLLYLRGLLKMRSANYEEAETLFTHAQSEYSLIEIKNPRYTSTLLRDLGNSKESRGDHNGAISVYEQALNISEEQLGENHPDTAASLDSLASLYREICQYEKAETLYLRALGIREKQLGEDHPDTATSLSNLVELYITMSRDEEAISTLERWRLVQHERQATQTNLFAISTVTLGKLYEKRLRQPEAVAMTRRVMTEKISELSVKQQSAIEQQSVGEYLSSQSIERDDFTKTRGQKSARLVHQMTSRTKVLTALIIPMYVVPVWLMVMISLPAFNITSFSERMQFALLSALVSDLIGIFYILTRDLFPKKSEDEENVPDEEY